jgi:multidrug resistance efflux pump
MGVGMSSETSPILFLIDFRHLYISLQVLANLKDCSARRMSPGRPVKLRQKAKPKTYEPSLGISFESRQKANQGASDEEAGQNAIWETTRWVFHDVRY